MRQNVTPSPRPVRPDASLVVAFPRLAVAALLCAGLLLPACASQENTAASPPQAAPQPSNVETHEDEERKSDVIVLRPWTFSDSVRTFSFNAPDGDSSRVFTFRYGDVRPNDSLRIHFDSLRSAFERSWSDADSLFSMQRRVDSLQIFRMDSLRAFQFENDGFAQRFRFWSDRNQAQFDSLRDSAERLMREFTVERPERLRKEAERLREQAERLEKEAERLEREDEN